MLKDPRAAGPRPPFPPQQQPAPGHTAKLDPVPDNGAETSHGSGKLNGCVALITGGDSGRPGLGAILPVTGGKPML